jgi:Pentapeptide repeats (8 copies)
MQKVNFKNAEMTSVNFSGANLGLANLTNATAEYANFTGADLGKANFSGAKLTGANFSASDLTKANFTGAIVDDAIFTGAKGYKPPDDQLNLNEQQNLHRQKKSIVLLNQFSQIKPLQLQGKDIKTMPNKFSDSVFDISLGEEVLITEIDDDEDNVILYIDKQPTGILYPRDELKKAYIDRTAVFIGCNKSSMSAVPISIVNTNNVYIKLNVTIVMFIKLQHMVQLLSSKHREWFLQQSDKDEEFTANVHHVYDSYNPHNNIFNQPLNIVSGAHCQPGSNKPVYNLTPIKFTSTPARNLSPVIPSPIIQSPLKNKQKRCPKGTQKNKRTGNCDKKGSASPNVIAINDTPEVQILPNVVAVQPKDKRCPKGTRKNKATGNCEPK